MSLVAHLDDYREQHFAWQGRLLSGVFPVGTGDTMVHIWKPWLGMHEVKEVETA